MLGLPDGGETAPNPYREVGLKESGSFSSGAKFGSKGRNMNDIHSFLLHKALENKRKYIVRATQRNISISWGWVGDMHGNGKVGTTTGLEPATSTPVPCVLSDSSMVCRKRGALSI